MPNKNYIYIYEKYKLQNVVREPTPISNEEALANFPIEKLNKLEELISLIR